MAKTVELLLTENVESLGIVGDVVKVRTGYARNYLLPRSMATTPSEEAIKAVAAKRADAEKQLAELRKKREETIKKLQGLELTMQRSCNDLGHLYASVTQQEIATALQGLGYDVRPRDVRLHQVIKRIDTYDIHIKFEAELESVVKLWVVADRKLDLDKAAEAEAEPAARAAEGAKEGEPAADGEAKPAKKGKKADGAEGAGEKSAKAEKAEKVGVFDKRTPEQKRGEVKSDKKHAEPAGEEKGKKGKKK